MEKKSLAILGFSFSTRLTTELYLDTRHAMGYTLFMITSFRHKGLKRLFEKGITSGISSEYIKKVRRILALLETSSSINDMDLPGLNLHELKGNREGTWAVKVSGNWRITFRLENGDVHLIDYEDYH